MNQSGKIEFLSPVGRMVGGHPMEKNDKDINGRPMLTTAGQPTQKYVVILAFAKGDPEFDKFWGLLASAAPGQLPPWDPACRFSWKVQDGDGLDGNGKPNNTKEGYPGHWIVKFQSSFAPRCFYLGRYGGGDQIQDPNVIKRGYYGRVSGTIEPNGNAQKPGLYVNLNMFELVALGPVITSGPDAAAVFGAAPAVVLPAGAQALPGNVGTPPAAGVPSGVPHAAPPMTPPAAAPAAVPGSVPTTPHATILNGPGASAPPAMPGAVPGLGVPPAAGFPTPGAAAPAAPNYGAPGVPPGTPGTAMGAPMSPSSPPMAPQAPAAQPTQARDPQGNVWPLAQLLGGGWTVDTLRANGYALF